MSARLLSNKARLEESRIDEQAESPLADGEAQFAIDKLALTTNNITYAVMGDAMQYWQFFPTGQDGWGQMPAWGFANVIASRAPGVEVGDRYYGYFPLAKELRMRPLRASPRGFYDGTPHRASLVTPYNQYTRCGGDLGYAPQLENLQALLRPLFSTGLFVADFLTDNAFFGARRVVVSSASSKTAYGTAYCLRGSDVELVALTSGSHRGYVEELGCYQRVLSYDDALEPDLPTLYLDFAGDHALRERVHQQTDVVYDCAVGFTQGTAPQSVSRGAAPVFFFVFDQIKKRSADWGPEQLARRLGEAQRSFFQDAKIDVVEHAGLEAAAALIAEFARGRIDPRLGHIVAP